MSRAYEVLKKFEAPDEIVPDLPHEKTTDDSAGFLRFPELAVETFDDANWEFERLYKNILVHGGDGLRTTLVCGTKKGDGVTTTALNLAAWVAMNKNIPVLIVEANLKTPTFFKYTRGRIRDGFCDLLFHQGHLVNSIMKTTIPNLYAMGAGTQNGYELEEFSMSRVRAILQECLSDYPFVVFDSTPADDPLTIKLAKCVDGVIMVLKSTTPAKAALEAKNSLERVGAKIIGIVLD